MSTIKVTSGMEEIKTQLDGIYNSIEPLTMDITSNIDIIREAWKGMRSDTILKDIEEIKKNTISIKDNLRKNIDFIDEAYRKYKELEAASISQETAVPVPIETPVQPVVPTSPSTTETPVQPEVPTNPSTTEPPLIINNTGDTIIPNIGNLKFNYDENGNIKKYKNTDFYPVRGSDGTGYLIYFGGRTPTDPIPSNTQIVFGLHGSGEKGPSKGYDYEKLFNAGVANYIQNSSNKPNIIAIVPQMRDGTIYSDTTINSFHEIYTNIQRSYQAKPGMDLSGISLGGQVSIRYIAKYPEDISSATILSGGVPYNVASFKFNEQEMNNLRKSNILFIAGKNDSKADTYKRQVDFYNKLTGNNVPDYTITSNTPLDDIANSHRLNGGIVLVQMSDLGHNTWKYSIPTIMSKYN